MLEANRGSQPSYGWNSLRFGCELIKKGIQVIIGDGKSTKLGPEPWLPINPPRPPRLLDMNNADRRVNLLINPTTSQWDEQRIFDLIHPDDHQAVMKIFLPNYKTNDSLIWSHTKDGNYTVKSGYWRATYDDISDKDPKPALIHHTDIATKIWNFKVAPKIKHFIWRMASRALPVAENLIHRNIHVSLICSRCLLETETTDHTFFTCPHSAAIWRATGLPYGFLTDSGTSVEDKLRYLFIIADDSLIENVIRLLPLWTLWRIWKDRNELVFQRRTVYLLKTLWQAQSDVTEWLDSMKDILSEDGGRSNRQDRQSTRWKKPKQDWVKCNYDVSHHEGNQTSGLGWILRNSDGVMLICGMGKFQGRHLIEEAELSALIWAIQASWSHGYTKVEFEGDNYNINKILTEDGVNPRLQHYIETIRLWKHSFSDINFHYKPRLQNMCADYLAKQSLKSDYDWSLYYDCPEFLLRFVKNDIAMDHQ